MMNDMVEKARAHFREQILPDDDVFYINELFIEIARLKHENKVLKENLCTECQRNILYFNSLMNAD